MSKLVDVNTFVDEAAPFLARVGEFVEALPAASLDTIIEQAGGPDMVTFVVVDMLCGFTTDGPLASPRVQALSQPIADLLQAAINKGVKSFHILRDLHEEGDREFLSYPPHCIDGTKEAEHVPEISNVMDREDGKNGVTFGHYTKCALGNVAVGGMFGRYSNLKDNLVNDDIGAVVFVGDCTDLCIEYNAMHALFMVHEYATDVEVYVPEQLVATYDLPLEAADAIGATPHPGDLWHALALWKMNANGIKVVKSISID